MPAPHFAGAFARLAGALVAVALALAGPAVSRAGADEPRASVPVACAGATQPVTELRPAERRTALRCAIVRERRRLGRGGLRPHVALDRVATAHTLDMVWRGYFAHGSPDGARIRKRLSAARLWPPVAGETLAWACAGRLTPGDTVARWMRSPPHRRVLLDPRFRHVGAGVVLDTPEPGCPAGVTWTAVFARFDY